MNIKAILATTAVTICCLGNDVPAKAQYVEPMHCAMTTDRAMLAAMGCPTMVTPSGQPIRESVSCAMTTDRMMRAALGCPAQIYQRYYY